MPPHTLKGSFPTKEVLMITPQILRESLLASGLVTSIEGLDEERVARLVQFAGVLSSGHGLGFSVRGSARALSLEIRTPETHKHQQSWTFREELPNPRDPRLCQEEYLENCSARLTTWLTQFSAEAPQNPELISDAELAEVRELEARRTAYSSRDSQAFQEFQADSSEANGAALTETTNEGDALQAEWEALYRRIYTWTETTE